MNEHAIQLRGKHPRFHYKSFNVEHDHDNLVFSYEFRIDPDITFLPSIEIGNVPYDTYKKLSREVLDNLGFHLGLVEIPSYWKASCSPEIVITAGSLDDYQVAWWKNLLIKGMGQFFYTNQIDFTSEDFVKIIAEKDHSHNYSTFDEVLSLNRILVLVGGGKDSSVTLDILGKQSNRYEIGNLLVNPTLAALQISDIGKYFERILVKRTIDPKLLKLNSEGYLNGHTPISAVLAFIGITCSLLFDYSQVVLSNERSSNEENTHYLGYTINHQYSKSFEFETLFREYVGKYISSEINFFSFLRPLYEIQIARYFSEIEHYHGVIRSCNRGQKDNEWCKDCPKCLSTFLLLSPYLKSDHLVRMFGGDLFSNPNLNELALQLAMKDKPKPFECVGTYEESLVAYYLSIKKRLSEEKDLPVVLKVVQRQLLKDDEQLDNRAEKLLSSWDTQNHLTGEFAKILKEAMKL
ncbi:hypothetical protein D4S03_05260 [bacterium]|nr:MAG: hypothetical protein D4S03_05260 [bacterium]